jgi:hypothetical protein
MVQEKIGLSRGSLTGLYRVDVEGFEDFLAGFYAF